MYPAENKYLKQITVLYYLYRGKHVFGESYESWMIPWMIGNPDMTIQMLKDYYGVQYKDTHYQSFNYTEC